jgi:hypothetical protein
VWVPVGKGVKKQEEVDALACYLFDDEQGEEELLAIDEKIGKLPGLSGIRLMSKALYEARARIAKNPEWAWRLIDDEAWAIAAPKHSPIDQLTGRRRRRTCGADGGARHVGARGAVRSIWRACLWRRASRPA